MSGHINPSAALLLRRFHVAPTSSSFSFSFSTFILMTLPFPTPLTSPFRPGASVLGDSYDNLSAASWDLRLLF